MYIILKNLVSKKRLLERVIHLFHVTLFPLFFVQKMIDEGFVDEKKGTEKKLVSLKIILHLKASA